MLTFSIRLLVNYLFFLSLSLSVNSCFLKRKASRLFEPHLPGVSGDAGAQTSQVCFSLTWFPGVVWAAQRSLSPGSLL